MRASSSPGIRDRFIRIFARRKFQEIIVQISKEVSATQLEFLAVNGISLDIILKRMGRSPALIRESQAHPAVLYLRSLSIDDLISLINEVAPAHAQVLKRHPSFARDMAACLKGFVSVG